jgi:GxxExxY protein
VNFRKTTQKEELIAERIVDAAYKVHKALGPGLLEKVYETCFCHELTKAGISYQKQLDVPIKYDDIELNEGLRLDILIEDSVICELKAIDEMNPVYMAQVLSYLRLTGKRLGFLINFNMPVIKNGIKRVIL